MLKIDDSERLRYALMGPQDADLLFELDQDPAVMKYINGGHCTTMQEVHEVFLPRMAAYTNVEKGWGLWRVNRLDTDEYIGWVLVRPMDFFGDAVKWDDWELGWRLKQNSWGHGFATEAARQIMAALAAQPTVNRFSAIAMEDNTASISIMKKLGMVFIKKDIHKDPLGDEEVVYYSMEKSSA